MKEIKTLLVELPFKNPKLPNLGLSSLKASLESNGYQCEIYYANIEFLDFIPFEHYQIIAQDLPQQFLIGDLIFSSQFVSKKEIEFLYQTKYQEGSSNTLATPEWLWDKFELYQFKSQIFIDKLAEKIAKTEYSLVGFNVMFQILPSLCLAKRLKKLNKNIKIIFGGANCEGNMGYSLHESFDFIDFICRGDGEQLIVNLVHNLSNKKQTLFEIEGLIWRMDEKSITNGSRAPIIMNLDSLPTPNYKDWEIKLEEYGIKLSAEDKFIPIETSRGCWYGFKNHCTFCGLIGENFIYRYKSANKVLQELESYQSDNFYALDLILPNKYFDDFIPTLIKNKKKYTFYYEIKANLTKNQLLLLKEAGIILLQPGIESLNTPILKLMKKGVSAYQNVRLLKWAFEIGINLYWNLLYGFPNEDANSYFEMNEIIPNVSHLRPPFYGCCQVRIDRFSPLYNQFSSNKKLKPVLSYNFLFKNLAVNIDELAYFFEIDDTSYNESFTYLDELKFNVKEWRSSIGESILALVLSKNDYYMYDSRKISKCRWTKLSELEGMILVACDEGVFPNSLPRLFPGESGLDDAISKLVFNNWLLSIDNRYLSLPVNFSKMIPADLPLTILPNIVYSSYKRRMLSMCKQDPH